MAKYLFIAVLFSLPLIAADSVSLSQKGPVVTLIITTDGSALIAEFNKEMAALESQRAESLKDKVSTQNGVEVSRVALTQQQKDFVNAEYDNRIVSYKRMLKLKMMDQAGKLLNVSIQRASVGDTDIAAEKAAAKAKIDAEYAAKEALKPTEDLELDKK